MPRGFLITRKANVNLAESCRGQTALHFTSDIGNIPMPEIVKFLVSSWRVLKGADVKMLREVLTALDFAAFQGHEEVVDFLSSF